MKKIGVVLIVICGLVLTSFAQTSSSGGTRTRRVETSPVPNTSPQQPSGNDSGDPGSTVNKRQSALPPFLGGSVRSGGNSTGNNSSSSNNNNSTSDRTPSNSSSGNNGGNSPAPNEKTLKKPPILVNSAGEPAPSTSSQTSSLPVQAANDQLAGVEEDDEIIKVETELVTIPVTVLDREGRFMAGLQQSDFKVLEDGQPQEISYFNTTEQAFTVILLLDVSNSTKFKIDEIQTSAIAFVDQLKANDRVMVISFDDNINVLSEPTSDRRQLYNAIRQANFNGGTSLYDAVNFAINRRLNQIEGRKAVVLFTDGVDTTSKSASYQSTLRDAEELDATFYPVYYNTYNAMQNSGGGGSNYPQRRNPYPRRGGSGIGGIIGIILNGGNLPSGGGGGRNSGSSRSDYERGEQYLSDLAAKTGGRKYDADSAQNLDLAFSHIAEELRRQYSIGYYPTATGQAGQRKQVKVAVNRPNSIVRARGSYIVGEQKSNSVKSNFSRSLTPKKFSAGFKRQY